MLRQTQMKGPALGAHDSPQTYVWNKISDGASVTTNFGAPSTRLPQQAQQVLTKYYNQAQQQILDNVATTMMDDLHEFRDTRFNNFLKLRDLLDLHNVDEQLRSKCAEQCLKDCGPDVFKSCADESVQRKFDELLTRWFAISVWQRFKRVGCSQSVAVHVTPSGVSLSPGHANRPG